MKRIKLFEGFQVFHSSYEEVNATDYVNNKHESIEIKKYLIDKILLEIKGAQLKDKNELSRHSISDSDKIWGVLLPKYGHYLYKNTPLVNIASMFYMIEDDWIFTKIHKDDDIRFYKCDQIEGFIKLLKDLKVV